MVEGAADLLPPGAVLARAAMDDAPPPLLAAEEPLAAGVRDRRRRELAWGRACARDALAALGHGPVPVGADADGVPTWPAGTVGSISHGAGRCVAVAAPTTAVAAIGVDVEPVGRLSAGVIDRLATPREQAAHDLAGPAGTVLLSAKESVYKCLSPGEPFLDVCRRWTVLLGADGWFTVEGEGVGEPPVLGRHATGDEVVLTVAWRPLTRG